MELADRYGIGEYPTPAGGCLLTDPGFSGRARELMEHEGLTVENIQLLDGRVVHRLAINFAQGQYEFRVVVSHVSPAEQPQNSHRPAATQSPTDHVSVSAQSLDL